MNVEEVINDAVPSVELPTDGSFFGNQEKKVVIGGYNVDFMKSGGSDCVQISNADVSWMVRVGFDSESYGVIKQLVDEYDGDGDKSDIEDMLKTIFLHMQLSTGIVNGYFMSGVQLLTEVYIDPSLMSGGLFNKRGREFRKRVDNLRKSFIEWSKRRADMMRKNEDEMDYDGEYLADETSRIISGESDLLNDTSEENAEK